MSDDIKLLPLMPQGLREAAQRGVLIPFIGAGASRIAGCPGWADFANGALRSFVGAEKFDHGQLAQINHLNPRVKLSIALALQNEFQIDIKFKSILHPTARQVNPKGEQLYRCISKLGKTFVTTNYDEWLDEEIPSASQAAQGTPASSATPVSNPRKVIHKVEELTPECLSHPNTVIHLHGSLLEPAGMIMTTQQYIKHYANDRSSGAEAENRVLTFLDYLFKNKIVLFIGYGLEELEILEYVILKAKGVTRGEKPEARHFLLSGFFSHERELKEHLKRYYLEECGIELVPFLRDRKDWEQLLDVLEEWARVIPASEARVLEDLKSMEDILNA